MAVQLNCLLALDRSHCADVCGVLGGCVRRGPIKNSACLECHADKTLTKTNAAGKEVSLFVDVAKLAASVHKTNTCASCHADITDKHPDDDVAATAGQLRAVPRDSNRRATAPACTAWPWPEGRKDSATCSDCHDGHTILPPTSPDSPLHFSRLAETCGACHDQAAKDVEESVHGKAVAAGHRDAPTCTDCHSEHKIEGAQEQLVAEDFGRRLQPLPRLRAA